MKPLDLRDMAVLGAIRQAQQPVAVLQLAEIVASPNSGPGIHLSPHSIRRVVGKLRARGLAEHIQQGWMITEQGRALWAAKGTRFTF